MTAYDPLLANAAALCQLGIKIFPLGFQSKIPIFSKLDWRAYATANYGEFLNLLRSSGRQAHNLAIALGPTSGVIDLEMDSAEGEQEFATLEQIFGRVPTLTYRSSRGVHRLFRYHGAISDKAVVKYRGMELRTGTTSKGAYSAAPPSLHESGVWYQWEQGLSPWEVPLANLPHHIEDFFKGVHAQRPSNSTVEMTRTRDDDFVPEPGQRHAFSLRVTHLLAGVCRLPRDLVVDMMMPYQDYVGKTTDLGSEMAKKEIADMVQTVQRPELPEDVFAEVDFEEVYESARALSQSLKKPATHNVNMPSVFPPDLEKFGCAAHSFQVPRHHVLMNALAAASASLGTSVLVQPSIEAAPTGLQIYSLGVGGPSSGKSKALKAVLESLTTTNGFVTNATPEALISSLARESRGILLQMAEGSQLTKMLGKYSDKSDGGTDNTVLLEAWSGDTIVVTRQDTRRCVRIRHPFMSIAASVQPFNLPRCFSVNDVMEGLMQRMLIFEAEEIPEEATAGAGKAFATERLRFETALSLLRNFRPHLGSEIIRSTSSHNPQEVALACDPLRFVFDSEGEKIWREYARLKRDRDNLDLWPEEHPFRADMLRHAEYVLRIAGVMYAVHLAYSGERWRAAMLDHTTHAWLPAEFVRGAIALMEWLWGEKQRLMSLIVEDRFIKANPEQAFRSATTLPEAVENYALRRYRTLLPRLKGATTWTAREFQRCLHLKDASAVKLEVEYLQRFGLVEQAAGSTRTQRYKFSERLIEIDRQERTSTRGYRPSSR